MRFFLYISYNGTNYHGWQRQKNAQSIQELIEYSLKTITKQNLLVTGSGRTDTGVHAIQQVAHFDIKNLFFSFEDLVYKLNSVLPSDISINHIVKVKSSAHARFDAIKRCYIYKICFKKNPFLFKKALLIHKNLNLDILNKLSSYLSKIDNFKSFTKNYKNQKNFICKIYKSEWRNNNGNLEFEIQANRFLHGMVRSLVGTMIKASKLNRYQEYFENVVMSKNRIVADNSIDPCGLYLYKIDYPKEIFIS